MAEALCILIADDQWRARQSLKALLATKFQSLRILEAQNGVEAVKCVKEWLPDIVFMDARMPDLDGIEATRVIKRETPLVRVIVLSMFPEHQAAALEAGADAFMCKSEPPEGLLAALSAMTDSTDAEEP
jgi:CheY-like chemotaxis protein